MPIITKPATIEKNSPAEISLDKAALAAVPSVVANDYFSDSDNWKEVFIYYKSSTGNQKEVLKFNAELASPTANFLVSDKALDIFEIQKIVIVDFDAGNITIPRSQLTTADFDVDMTPPSGPTEVVLIDQSIADMSVNLMYNALDVARQSFSFVSPKIITSVSMYFSKINNATGQIGAKIKLVSDNSVLATSSTLVEVSTIPVSYITPALFTFNFNNIHIDENTPYYIEIYFIDIGTVSGSAYLQAWGTNTDPYSGGNLSYITNGSLNSFAGWDFGFKIMGNI